MFQAYCSACKKTMAVLPILDGSALKKALDENSDVRVMDSNPGYGDHVWSLSQQDKKHLRNAIATGLL